MAEPEKKSPAPVEVVNTEPLQVQIIAPEKDPLLLDLDIARAQPKPNVEPVAQTQATTTTTVTTNALPPATVTKGEGQTLAPTTTEQDDLVTQGQRDINKLWEETQSKIALLVVVAGVVINSILILLVVFLDREVSTTQLALLSISLQFINLTTGIVIGFYFSRVNHEQRGGTGKRPQPEAYTGR